MTMFVGNRNQPAACRDGNQRLPQRRHFDPIDAVAPGVPLGEHRFVQAVRKLPVIPFATGAPPQLAEFRLDVLEDVHRQHPLEKCAQEPVIVVRVTQSRRRLDEGAHG